MRSFSGIVWALISITLLQCGSGAGPGKTLSIPQVAPLVTASLPAGLRPGATTTVVRDAAARDVTPDNTNGDIASDYIINLFQNTFASATGFVQGYILAQIATVDSRMSFFQGKPITGCLANPAAPLTLDLSAIDPMLDFTLKDIQCDSPFGSDPATDAGEAFGQSGTTSSLWVQASDSVATTGTAGLIYANVDNAGSTTASAPEQVDGVVIVFNPNTSANTGGTLDITRFIASPTNKTFEMFFGSSGGVIGTTTSNAASFIGTGFRMISDGNFIYADGTLCTDSSGLTCHGDSTAWQAFDVCLDATTVAPHTPASDCASLANSFTLNNSNASLTFQEITGDANLTDSYGAMTSAVGPTAANAALVEPLCEISFFSTAATKF